MKSFDSLGIFILLVAALLVLDGCTSSGHFTDRKYTSGQFHERTFFKSKSGTKLHGDSTRKLFPDSIAFNVRESIGNEKAELKENVKRSQSPGEFPASEILAENYPLVAQKMDSVFAQQIKSDTSWMQDSVIPRPVEVAFGSQGVLAIGTVGGLITTGAPGAIWWFFPFMLIAPIALVVSLIAAAVALGKINTGQIDKKYNRAMRLWAVCLLLNLVISSVVVIHYASIW